MEKETTFAQNNAKNEEVVNSRTDLVPKDKRVNENKPKITGYLIVVSAVCFFGSSLQFGYNLSVINAPENIVKKFYQNIKNFDDIIWPIAVSIFAIGGMFGAFIGPQIAKRIGRKSTLMFNNVLPITGGILLFCTKYAKANNGSVGMMIIGRILLGINAGINTSVAPMYLSEIAPVKFRGALGTLNQFGIVTGILLGNVFGLSELLGTESGWNIMFGLTALVAVLQLFFLPFCPKSPRYLIAIKNDEQSAITSLKKLRGKSDVSEEVNEIKLEAARESSMESISVIGLLKDSQYHKPLLISVVMQLAQQLSGIGGILYYSTSLFQEAGLPMDKGQAASCGVGALSVLCTIVVIVLVDVKGRKFLLLFGLGGMGLLYIVVTISFYYSASHEWAKILGVVSTLAAVAVFQLGPGPIPWFLVAELFSQQAISAAVSIAGPTNWFGNFIVGLLFPTIKKLYPYTFVPFIILLFLFFAFTLFVVPETKGLTIAEINAKLNKKKNNEEPNENDRIQSSN